MPNKTYKILVVDDEPDVTETLQNRLSREGFLTAGAFSGEEALVKLKEEDADLVLLDLMLPGINGFDVLKEIREKFTDRWRPVIIVSGKTDLESVKACYGLEADHYLTKPCDFQHILNGVRTMISLIPLRI